MHSDSNAPTRLCPPSSPSIPASPDFLDGDSAKRTFQFHRQSSIQPEELSKAPPPQENGDGEKLETDHNAPSLSPSSRNSLFGDSSPASLPTSHSPIRSQSIDPLSFLFDFDPDGMPAVVDPPSAPASPTYPELSPLRCASPLTPPPPSQIARRTPEPPLVTAPTLPPPPHLGISVQQDDIPFDDINLDNFDNLPNASRYPLRRRGPNQLKPYTVEKYQYKQALSSNPDAIVKFRSPIRNPRRRGPADEDEDADDSQEPWVPDERFDRDGTEMSRHDVQPASNVLDYSGILQDLPSTDDDEAEELRALSKEARHVVRLLRAREARSKELTKRKQKVKAFPFRQEESEIDQGEGMMQDRTSAPSPVRNVRRSMSPDIHDIHREVQHRKVQHRKVQHPLLQQVRISMAVHVTNERHCPSLPPLYRLHIVISMLTYRLRVSMNNTTVPSMITKIRVRSRRQQY